jgi:hypothetical protein
VQKPPSTSDPGFELKKRDRLRLISLHFRSAIGCANPLWDEIGIFQLRRYSGFRIAVPKGNTLKSTRPQGAATSQ